MKRATKTGLLTTIFLTLSLLTVGAIHFSHEDFEVAKADAGEYLGEVSITAVKHYDPYWNEGSNQNEHFILQLDGSDYPTFCSDTIRYVSSSYLSPLFTDNIATHLQLSNRSGGTVNVTTYWEAYYCQKNVSKAFSFGLAGFGDSAAAIIKKGFKIPSYAMLKGDTTSATYGYYTVDKTYTAKLINTAPRSEGLRDWTLEEYNPTKASINAVYSYVDGTQEFITFNLFGSGVDYPTSSGPGNYHFEGVDLDTILPNFYNKVHFYDANGIEQTYAYTRCTIDLWALHLPRISMRIDEIRNFKKVKIDAGLTLPSYARFSGDTASDVYAGFTITNELFLSIDESYEHTTGAQIPWIEHFDEIGTLSLTVFKTNHPFADTNENEFFIFQFNETCDFSNIGHNVHWDTNRVSLLDNFNTFFEIYDSSNTKMDANIISTEVIFNYIFDNSIAIMIERGQRAVRMVLKQGLHFPSYALHNRDLTNPNCGYYSLATTYNLNIQEGHAHVTDSINDWPLPHCPVEFYDENDNLISSLSDSVVLGATYNLPETPMREGYVNVWQLISPSELVVENNSFVAPLYEVTIKFKEHYEKIPVCYIEYYNEEGKLIPEYSVTCFCDTEYLLEPITSKKGHDGSWIVLEPEGIEIVNNRITTPSYETTIKLQAHFEARTYKISFEGVTAEPIYVKYGEKVGVLPEIPAITGKTGLWVIDETIITPETIFEFDENKVATIVYVDRICTITFDTDGAEEIAPMELVYGSVVESLPTPVKEGYFFDGWYTSDNQKYEIGQPLLDDITLRAHWLVKCTVTFDTDGGSLLQSVSLGSGQLVTKPTDPTKDGYEFLYWTLNGEEFDFSKPVTEDITLVAKWKEVAKPVEPEPEEPTNKISGGVLALIISSSVVAAAGIGLLIFLIIRKKKLK